MSGISQGTAKPPGLINNFGRDKFLKENKLYVLLCNIPKIDGYCLYKANESSNSPCSIWGGPK
jgi:hypothetical protein